ncbi:hypothetical protein F4801DRAFT_378330 [Xylaria longipes]|nr:hypothetical protein F4801DRAFT_378330 [Xylaria longipes]RYC64876.1 hypothetical protein CHU98_g1312 [Xylaria longipes]
MAPNWSMGNSYTDERRGSGSRWESSSYRPGDRERPQVPRRDPRDFRETRSPREQRRENEPPRPPNIETNFRAPEGPRKMSNNSPASVADKPGNELHFKRMNTVSEKLITTNSAIIDAPTTATPKAKIPELQEAFENAYKWGEKGNRRLLLRIRKNKVAQESAQRDLENEKYKSKAASYPPFHALSHKSNPADQTLDDQIKAAEDDYLRDLEQLVACFTTVAKPLANNHQDPAVTTLEAKIEQISQLAAKQTEQIQRLLEENDNSRNSVTSLETDFNSMKSSHSELEAKYSALKSDHEALQSKFRSYDDAIHALESKHVNIDAENQTLKKQLSELQSDTEKKISSSDAQLTELAKRTSDMADSRKMFERDFEQRIEAKLHNYDELKEKLDELDLGIFNEVQDAWVSSAYNLKVQHEEYKERRSQNITSTDDALRSLRQEVDSLRSSRSDVSQPDRGSTLSIQEVEEIVHARVAAAEETINNKSRDYSEKKDDLYADMISGVEARLDALEQGALEPSRPDTRIQSLEQWKIASSAWMDQIRSSDLSARVSRLEGQRVGHRVDRIDLDVGDLGRKYEVLKGEVGQLVKREWVEVRLQELLNGIGMNPGLINDVKDLQRKIPAIELAIKTLDTQFQNLSTKQLAEYIVRLTNPALEQRLGKLEVRANQLETKTNGHDRSVNRHTEQLNALTDFLRSTVPGEKRTASPGHLDEPSKRRKLEANGRHPSPLQQLQRNNSVQHPS